MTQSFRAASTATLRWAAKPGQGSFRITRAPAARAFSRVRSEEPESTTTISSQKATLCRASGSFASSLWVMTTAERGTTGEVYPREPGREPRAAMVTCRPCLRETDRTSWPSSASAGPSSKAISCSSSGLHSPRYLQCARVLMDPELASRSGAILADALRPQLWGCRAGGGRGSRAGRGPRGPRGGAGLRLPGPLHRAPGRPDDPAPRLPARARASRWWWSKT